MYVYTCMHIHVYIYIYIYMCILVCIYTYIHICMYMLVYIYIYILMYIYICVCICMYIHYISMYTLHMYVYITYECILYICMYTLHMYIYIYMCTVYMCIYIYMQHNMFATHNKSCDLGFVWKCATSIQWENSWYTLSSYKLGNINGDRRRLGARHGLGIHFLLVSKEWHGHAKRLPTWNERCSTHHLTCAKPCDVSLDFRFPMSKK